MGNLAETLGQVLSKTEVKNDNLTKALEMLKGIEISEDESKKITSQLFSLHEAQNNPALKAHYTAQLLDGVDSGIKEMGKKLGIPESELETIFKAEGKTTQRLQIVAEHARKMLDEKLKALPDDESKKLKEKFAELQKQIENKDLTFAQLQEQFMQEKMNLVRENEQRILDFELINEIKKHELQKINGIENLALQQLKATLSEKQIKIKKTETGKIVLVKADDESLMVTDTDITKVVTDVVTTNNYAITKPTQTTVNTQTNTPGAVANPVKSTGFESILAEIKRT